jgi:hypothetical protein
MPALLLAVTHSTGPSLSQPAISSATPKGRLCTRTQQQGSNTACITTGPSPP